MNKQKSSIKSGRRKLLLIQKIALFLSKTQGRDKLCKLLQYVFKFLSSFYQIDSYLNIKYSSLSGIYQTIQNQQNLDSTKDARKIFRLFKSINQYEEMTYILFNQQQNLTNLLKILSRICFFFYWMFDNIAILENLGKIKLTKIPYLRFFKVGYSFWFFALIFMNITFIYQLFFMKPKSMKKISMKQLQSQLPTNCPLLPQFQLKKQIQKIQMTQQQNKQIQKYKILNLIKYSFDLIPAGKDSKILQIVFNRIIPQKFTTICGAISAAISIYQTSIQCKGKITK